ncbi:gas vesicle protein GvpJ [Pseudonocardia sp. CA-142604]|uniref:gas vesicle protein GvpJ n=1 Tax=Pseudonocardia sp. CA-142604 TaxID=3240024 RepID=UPI003D8C77A4
MTSGGLPLPSTRARPPEHRQESTNLSEILERIFDKGIVIPGDIRVTCSTSSRSRSRSGCLRGRSTLAPFVRVVRAMNAPGDGVQLAKPTPSL